MGSLFGGRLALANNPVVLVDVNEAHIAAVTANGLHLTTDDQDAHIRIPIGRAATFRDSVDLVLVFTKAPHTQAALESVRHLVGPDTWALTLQNGLDTGIRVAQVIPPERVALGVTNWPADLAAPGRVSSHGLGEVRIWSLSGSANPVVYRIASVLDQAGLRCRADAEVPVAIWEKVSFNAAMNAIAAVSGMRVGEMADSRDVRELAQSVVREAIATAHAEGVAVEESRVWKAIESAYAGHRDHRPSMLQDLLAGRQTEIESINGAIVSHAHRIGLSVPVNQTLTRLVRAVQARGPVAS
jgi:2-dehydropantoate 2-reductase